MPRRACGVFGCIGSIKSDAGSIKSDAPKEKGSGSIFSKTEPDPFCLPARVSAVVGMYVEDYYQQGKRSWIRLHEKGGKFHEVPAHHNAVEYLDAYIARAEIEDQKKGPLFRSVVGKTDAITLKAMSRTDVLRMIKRRGLACGMGLDRICCHTFRATGITAYLENGGTIENAQAIAAHESPRTTKLYDRTNDSLSLDEIERISI